MSLLNSIAIQVQNQLPFVLYVNPNENLLNSFFQKDKKIHEFDNQSGFVFSSFYNNQNIVFPFSESDFFQENLEFENQEDITFIENFSNEKDNTSFNKLIKKGISEIKKETFEKVVLSRKIEISKSIDYIKSFQNLLKKYPNSFRYLWFHPKIGMWLGASPEQFVKIENKTFETVALAGTQVYSDNIIWKEKEIVEQQLVTDYIKNRIENFVDKTTISKPYNHQAGNLVHIKSDISGKLKNEISEKEFISVLHPTSAICGMPLESSRKFIIENESYNRKYYTGFLGEFQIHKKTNLFVNLRCCEIENEKVSIYVGCGITKDSIPEKEFLETENKAKTILSVLVNSN